MAKQESASKLMSKAIKAMEKETEELITKGPAMNVENIYLPLNHLFNAASKRAFKNEVKELKPQREVKYLTTLENKVTDEVRFFGSKAVGERNIFNAAQKVANQVNELASSGFVSGVLMKLAAIQLVTEPFQIEQYVVVSYVAMTEAGLEYLRKNPSRLEMPIGGLPEDTIDYGE